MIIAFTASTSKILPRIFCRKFRHCAIIQERKAQSTERRYTMSHIASGRVHTLELRARDLRTLAENGWVFIKIKEKGLRTKDKGRVAPTSAFGLRPSSFSCVVFVKRAIGLRAPFVWTPLQLYKNLEKKCASINKYK